MPRRQQFVKKYAHHPDMALSVAYKLRSRRLSLWNEARLLAENAAAENRSFTPDEQGRWERMQKEMKHLDRRIEAALDTVYAAEGQS